MNNKITWLHLSDVHYAFNNFDTNLMRNCLLDKLRNLSSTYDFSFIVVTGDLSYKSKLDTSAISEFFDSVLDILNLDKNRLFIVPGNHDVDRKIIPRKDAINTILGSNSQENDLLERLDILNEGFKNFYEFYEDYFGEVYLNDNNDFAWVKNIDGINIIGINTAICCVKNGEEGNLLLNKSGLLNQLQKISNSNSLNIAIGHHGLDCLKIYERDKVLHLFDTYNVGLYLCGHIHNSSVNTNVEGMNEITTLTCGSIVADEYATGSFVVESISLNAKKGESLFYLWNRKNDNWIKNLAINRKHNADGTIDFSLAKSSTDKNEINIDIDAFQDFIISFVENFERKNGNSPNLEMKDINDKFTNMKCNRTVERQFKKMSIHFPTIDELISCGLISNKNFLIIENVVCESYNKNFDKYDKGHLILEAMVNDIYGAYKNKIKYPEADLKNYIKIVCYWFINECDIFDDIKE